MLKLGEALVGLERPMVMDGAMGTQLAFMGLEMGGVNNITCPAAVLDIHRRYAESGADILITNSLTMNRVYIETHHLGLDVREVNLAGVRLARAAAGGGRYVLGDIGATGQMLEPYGELTEEAAFAAYAEQADILAEGGADGFIIETMFDLRDALCALRACRSTASGVPVMVSLSFNTGAQGARTMMGNSVEECALALEAQGADVIGANCGSMSVVQYVEVVKGMRAVSSLPVLVQPNAGQPEVADGKTSYNLSPEEFAAGIAQCLSAGARVVGGCCGTSPEHIKAIAELAGSRV
ncbi:MAG: homocysteine S-methyltransferase family protein [Kiritimatiellae bacterium]|nr:homocysteine S-methyltransferase family protein [Kiritimatiellia bacterium]